VAEKEHTNVSPSCPVFLLNSPGVKSCCSSKTGSALPTDVSLPHSHEGRLRCSDPVAKGNLAPLGAAGKLPCLPAWALGKQAGCEERQPCRQPHSAGSPRFAGRAWGDASRGYSSSIPLLSQHRDGVHRCLAIGHLPLPPSPVAEARTHPNPQARDSSLLTA